MTSYTKSVVFVTPSLGAGGIERVISDLANYMARLNFFSVHIICFGNKPVFYPLESSIEVITLPDSPIKAIAFFKKLIRLRSILKTIKPNAMISFGSKYNSFFLLSSIGVNGKKFVSDRSNPWRNSRLTLKKGGLERHDGLHHYFLKKFLYPQAHKILAQTKLSARIEERNFGKKKVLYFPNPIHSVSQLNKKKEKIILNVGRFVESKRQKDLIQIFSQISPELKNGWRLVFLGGGDRYFTEAQNLAQRLGMENEVCFLGYVKDVRGWYERASIFAFTSSSEGFPNALAEAMSYGCASVAYNCVAGPSDLIDNGCNGVLIPLGDQKKFKSSLENLITDVHLRERFQQQAKQVSEKFKFGTIAQKLIDEID